MGEDIIRVVLKRGGGGIGLSIVAAQVRFLLQYLPSLFLSSLSFLVDFL
ncbi:unnamed protein product [Cylicostephanus goldi]|uniref:Uncharacterized protein n=1 Tax=Cylicostephanus goldi TaxID=71465 RepID=A0A3P7N0Z3_CYLGO|nr:unnamed protein product [Cylicostephanus goldi]